MHPNNILNVGTNPSVLIVAGILIVISFFVGGIIEKKVKEADIDVPFVNRYCRRWYIVGIVSTVCILWVLFSGYGAGDPTVITPASADGANEIVQDEPPMPLKEDVDIEMENRKPESLKELESNLSNGIDEDDYIQRAIERSKQMRGEK